MATSKFLTTLLLPVALLGATTGFIAGCGDGGIDQSKVNDLKSKAANLQNDAKKTQDKIKQIQADVKSGKISAAKGQQEMEAAATAIQKKAKATASEGIDAIKNNSHLSADEKKQLEDAQAQLGK